MTGELDEFKQVQRRMWEAGDYAELSPYVAELSEGLVEATGVRSGMEVLDIGTGSGTGAILAAQRGARATGLDLAPALLDRGREAAAKADVEVAWVEGDAEALPFDNESFDVVISSIGHMFAPRHRQAADEMLRVCKSGGAIGFCAWTPEGLVGEIFAKQGPYMPPPPDYASPPILWGSEDHVREMIGDGVADLDMKRRAVTIEFDGPPDQWLEYFADNFGPLTTAREMVEPQGRWDDLARELTSVFADANEVDQGMRFKQEYLLVAAKRR